MKASFFPSSGGNHGAICFPGQRIEFACVVQPVEYILHHGAGSVEATSKIIRNHSHSRSRANRRGGRTVSTSCVYRKSHRRSTHGRRAATITPLVSLASSPRV